MNYLSVQNLTKYYGEKILFDNLTYNIDKGQRVAFIAKNGSGKSTMLKILQNQEPQESGVFSFHKDVQVGFLTQEPSFDGKLNVYETILRQKNPKLEAALAYEEALEGIGDLNKAMEAIDSLNAWDYEAEVKHILTKLQIFDLHQKVETLSGGQKRRLALAALLIHQPDLMILDEPTNHLDIEMIEWLEEYLSQSHITLLLITHDRYFLESVCNEILELEDGMLYRHRGNYSNYIENKLLREENQRSNQLKAQNIFRRELEWMRKQPKARTTKSKSRIDAFEDVSNRAKKRTQEEKVQLEIKMERLGGKILEFHNVSKSISNKLLLKNLTTSSKKEKE
jgi:ATP-binding cassette subfamily F protein uup